MRSGTHRAMFARRVDGCLYPLFRRQVAGSPPRNRKLRMLRLISANHVVVVLEQNISGCRDQNRTKGIVSTLQRFRRQFHATPEVNAILIRDHNKTPVLKEAPPRRWAG